MQQKRFKSKINVQKPRRPHHVRAKYLKFVIPFYPARPEKSLPLIERCTNVTDANLVKQKEVHPYVQILAREALNWFNNSKMIAIYHLNPMNMEVRFNLAVPLKKSNMHLKGYGLNVLKLALEGTQYAAILPLFKSPCSIIFSSEPQVAELQNITKRTKHIILMAGILEGRLLSRNEFLRYGEMDLTMVRSGLVQVLQTAGGNNLNRQLTHHQSTLVSRLNQIEEGEATRDENSTTVASSDSVSV